jgi:adenylate cyclase
MTNPPTDDFSEAYPVQRRFRRWALPAAVVTFGVLLFLVGFGGTRLIEGVYLNLAEGRAKTILTALEDQAPEPWHRMVSGGEPAEVYAGPGGDALKRVLVGEVRELGLAQLKVYDARGVIVFSTEAGQIGTPDPSDAFLRAIESGKKTVVRKDQPDGSSLYELYVPLAADGGRTRAVFELYETTRQLNAVLISTLLPAVDRLIGGAQRDIEGRTRLVNELRGKLERLVSDSAVNAAVGSVGKGRIASKKVVVTLFYSDIRDFTGFSETRPPEEVVDFLNQLMDLQVAAIAAEGGDVDKMIGDAVLARFEGDGAERRAVAASRRILTEIAAGDFPRQVGIGIFTGEVISGAVGGEQRMDFTVIGDSVNISARLCSAAAGGELVVDDATLTVAGADDFGPGEEITVKGRRDPLTVRRWRLTPSG